MMQVTLETWSGAQREGIVLCRQGLSMRVAVSGEDDPWEFRFRGGSWFDESGVPVRIDVHPAQVEIEVPPFCEEPRFDDAPFSWWLN